MINLALIAILANDCVDFLMFPTTVLNSLFEGTTNCIAYIETVVASKNYW